ncbi:MAG: ABC transporter ATP-binding protein [marine benthic group bacterium]|nr:ABC transporter ATP-binding protein [Gemmatimonadota bacterium]MCL7957292.1 ABC transporter ATP-binding protein [Gemmatimonadota bacterium]MCL7975662.1 ABC transporter ATP-binding protein [Gemmatimonadota bacterium]MCL7985984.1 ABC transporter ATP-binding protein [Gemmatimonadota bacterium]
MSAERAGREQRRLVEARDVRREYRLKGDLIEAVRGISLEVSAGDFLAIVGPSGSGKSTLLHLLGAVDSPTSGAIYLDGSDVTVMTDAERARFRLEHVGLVFQRFHLLPMLTALENVELPMAEAGLARKEREQRAKALLTRVGLGERLRHRPGEISGGQRQRVAVARALANRPALLLADEPTGELDQSTSAEMLELFQSLNEDGTAIVVATHDLQLAEGARRQMTLVDGKIRE